MSSSKQERRRGGSLDEAVKKKDRERLRSLSERGTQAHNDAERSVRVLSCVPAVCQCSDGGNISTSSGGARNRLLQLWCC